MSVEINKLANEPIVIMTFKPPFKPSADIKKANKETAKELQGASRDLYHIEDLSEVTINFGEVVEGMAAATQGDEGILGTVGLHTILVSPQSKLMQVVIDGFKQDQYGDVDITVFPTLKEALASARQRIVSEAISS